MTRIVTDRCLVRPKLRPYGEVAAVRWDESVLQNVRCVTIQGQFPRVARMICNSGWSSDQQSRNISTHYSSQQRWISETATTLASVIANHSMCRQRYDLGGTEEEVQYSTLHTVDI